MRTNATAKSADHVVRHHERGTRMLENCRLIPLEGEVAEKHDGVGCQEQSKRPERPERQRDDRDRGQRPANSDVEEMVDGMLMVLAIPGHQAARPLVRVVSGRLGLRIGWLERIAPMVRDSFPLVRLLISCRWSMECEQLSV